MKKGLYETYEIKVSRMNDTVLDYVINSPEYALRYWREVISKASWFDQEREQVVVVMMNTRLRILGFSIVSLGTANISLCHARDVFRPAIAMGAYGVLLMHNHPSGDSSPSPADLTVGRQVNEAGKLLDIPLSDSLIVGEVSTDNPKGYHSLREMGMI